MEPETENERLLNWATQEIQLLRRDNEILRAKVEMIDLFAIVFRSRPDYPSQGAGEDIVWRINRHLEGLREEKCNETR